MKQNWSRRELEAFGEPIGDSVTQRKLGGGYICGGGGKGGGGGGGGPPPSSQTVTQTSIPEYARPYVETMLGKTEALTDIDKNPYQAYGGQRIAGFSPLQERTFQDVANQTTAGQLVPATGLAAASGMGSLGTAGQMGMAGQQYAQQATNPYAQQAYMSPYIQNALQPQLQEMQRQYGITGAQQMATAAGRGAFGGSRDALMRAENERNKNIAMNAAIGSGYQNAFQAAQQAQQFGANLGLQGLQGSLAGYGQAGQAAGTLGQLGQTQFGQQQAINAARQQVGAVQQAQSQQGLDLAYQDFLKQRNYPYQQLAFMSDMTRGLPLSQAAQQVYTAPPNPVSQLGGLGMSALGIYGMSGGFKAKGGIIKEMAKGGLAYAAGGDIKTMTTEQLTELLDNPSLSPLEIDMIEKQLMIRRRMEMNPETEEIMAPALGGGVASIPTGNMVPMEQMAGGGIVAFSKGGDSGVDNLRTSAQARQSYRDQLESEVLDTIKRLKSEDPFKESRAQEADIRAQIAESKKMAPWEALTMAGLGTMAGTSQYGLSNLGLGATEGMKSYGRRTGEQADLRKLLLQQGVEREKSKFARETGLLGAQQTSLGQIYGREAALEQAKATGRQSDAIRESTLFNQASNSYLDKVAKEKETLRKRDPFNTEITEDELERQAVANVKARLPEKTKKILFGDEGTVPAASTSGQTVAPAAAPAAAPAKSKSLLGPYEKLPKVATQAEYDKLKPGAQYIDPNGNVRKKK
jgi:hypothetical protein